MATVWMRAKLAKIQRDAFTRPMSYNPEMSRPVHVSDREGAVITRVAPEVRRTRIVTGGNYDPCHENKFRRGVLTADVYAPAGVVTLIKRKRG